MERFWDVEQNENVTCPHARCMLSLLANGPHLELLHELAMVDEICVNDIAERIKLHEDSASAGLRHLHGFGMATVRREKRFHLYRLSHGLKVNVSRLMLEVFVANLDASTVHLTVPRNRVALPI